MNIEDIKRLHISELNNLAKDLEVPGASGMRRQVPESTQVHTVDSSAVPPRLVAARAAPPNDLGQARASPPGRARADRAVAHPGWRPPVRRPARRPRSRRPAARAAARTRGLRAVEIRAGIDAPRPRARLVGGARDLPQGL